LLGGGEAKVGDADAAATIEHDVGGLEVAMDDAVFVSGGEAGAELTGDVESFVGGDAADAAEEGGEVFAIDEFHGEEGMGSGGGGGLKGQSGGGNFAQVEDAADIGVRNLAGEADFASEAGERVGIAGERGGKKFKSDGLAEFEIFGAVDFAHAALAEWRDNAVAIGESGAGDVAGFVAEVGAGGRSGGCGRGRRDLCAISWSRRRWLDGRVWRSWVRRSEGEGGRVTGADFEAAGWAEASVLRNRGGAGNAEHVKLGSLAFERRGEGREGEYKNRKESRAAHSEELEFCGDILCGKG